MVDAERNPREHVAYRGGSSMGVPFPDGDEHQDDEHQDDEHTPDSDADPNDNETDGGVSGDESGGSQGRQRSIPSGVAVAGSGWVLGMLIWGWVVLPFLKSGPKGVGQTLRAKFLNQAADGSPLP